MRAKRKLDPCVNARTLSPTGKEDGLHILVVEDDSDTAELMASLLRLDGHRAEIALDGPSACRAARNKPPDVVLLDLALPGMDGWQVARRFQEPSSEKKPLLIALTGHGSEDDRRRSLESGIDLHLVKPLDPNFLRRVLARFYRILVPGEASSAHETNDSNR